jgi:nucleotide-binding universal stress UspA family protein
MNKDEAEQPIICGTDFSEHSREAAEVAAALAARVGRPLLLVHVGEQCDPQSEFEQDQERLVDDLQTQLRDEARRLESSGAQIEHVMLCGGLAEDGLLELIKERRPKITVVSSVSKTAFDHWTLGSVSEQVAERSPAPTLVARTAEPLLAWARGERALRVFVGVDFSGTSDAALSWTKRLREIAPCEVTVGHIYWPPDECRHFGFPPSTSLTDTHPDLHAAVERELTTRVHDRLGTTDAKIIVQANWGRPDAPLIELAKTAGAELLVVGTHQRHGLRRVYRSSTSRGVLHHAPMSVAVVPAAAEAAETSASPRVQRVLVSTDFSEFGDRAIRHAYAAVPQGGVVRLIHVVPPGERYADDEKKLRALIPEEAAARGVRTDVGLVEAKDVGRAITDEAERFGADLVCIASHGRGGILQSLLGSVAEQVIKRSHCPVMLLPTEKS